MDNLKDWALSVASKISKVSITERQAGDVTILGVEGNIVTGEGADMLRDDIRRLLAEGRRKFLLDMAHVRWVDSIGIGEMVSALVSITRAGGQIKLLKVRENIQQQLSITGMQTIFEIYDDESEALNAYL